MAMSLKEAWEMVRDTKIRAVKTLRDQSDEIDSLKKTIEKLEAEAEELNDVIEDRYYEIQDLNSSFPVLVNVD